MANYFRFRIYVDLEWAAENIKELPKTAVTEWAIRWSPGVILDTIKNNKLTLLTNLFDRKNETPLRKKLVYPLNEAFIAVYGDGWNLWDGSQIFHDKSVRAEIERLSTIKIFNGEDSEHFKKLLKFFETAIALSNKSMRFLFEVSY